MTCSKADYIYGYERHGNKFMLRYKYVKKINFQKIKRKIISNSFEVIFVSQKKQMLINANILK